MESQLQIPQKPLSTQTFSALLYSTMKDMKIMKKSFFMLCFSSCPSCASWLNLKTAVGREKDAQAIGVHGESEKLVVTLLVMRVFSDLPGALMACVDFRDPTAVFRLKLLICIPENRHLSSMHTKYLTCLVAPN